MKMLNKWYSAHTVKALAAASMLALLAACSGGGGADTTNNPVPPDPTQGGTYTGPNPADADVARFKKYVWDNLVKADRCGACHIKGGQTPTFVETDDVNLAYAQAKTVANLTDPGLSRMVVKVGGGHNCWMTGAGANTACADILTTYISNWANGASAGTATEVQLTAPVIRDPGTSRSLPSSPTLFATNLWTPYLKTHCSQCHSAAAQNPQQPFFASDDLDVAYSAAKSKINLDKPEDSRFVVRLRDESHNCWTSSCAADAQELLDAIQTMQAAIPLTTIDPTLLISKAMRLSDGIVAFKGARYTQSAIAQWQFKEGAGSIAFDTSGIEPSMHLDLRGDVTFNGGRGIQIKGVSDTAPGRAFASTISSKKLHDKILETGEYTIEAWMIPANVTQEGSALTYSGGSDARNFALEQKAYNYDFLQRMKGSSANGQPSLDTADAAERAQASLQHVVMTYDILNGRRIYVDGVDTGDRDAAVAGNLNDWDDTYAFSVGNEPSGDRQWEGIFKLLAIHNAVLTPAEITNNFNVGVGDSYYLMFSISHMIDNPACVLNSVPQCYIVYEVSQYDSHAYLFHTPFFASLNPAADLTGVNIKGIRIGINGKEAQVGQSYRHVDAMLGGLTPETKNRNQLSSLGTIVALENGPASDEFFLTFEHIDSRSRTYTEAAPPAPAAPVDLPKSSDIGVRTFDEINATIANMTGVSRNEPNVHATYATIRQSLPATEDMNTFLSSHQMSITQLAIGYCNALVEDASLRATVFPGFDFSASASTAFGSAVNRNRILDPLMLRTVGNNLSTQPLDTDVRGELNSLMDKLTACGAGCAADRTKTVVKASCSAAVGNAAMLVQ